MGIKIKIQRNLQNLTNIPAMIEVDGTTVCQCIEQMLEQFPEAEKRVAAKNKKLLDYVQIFVNGKSAYPNELAKTVKDGDEIFLALIFAGG